MQALSSRLLVVVPLLQASVLLRSRYGPGVDAYSLGKAVCEFGMVQLWGIVDDVWCCLVPGAHPAMEEDMASASQSSRSLRCLSCAGCFESVCLVCQSRRPSLLEPVSL